jgi:hypothetical protein
VIRRPTLRARLLASSHFFNGDETGGAGASSSGSSDPFGDDGLPADDAPAAATGELGDDGLPKGEAPKGDEAPKEKPAEYVDDPKLSAEENATKKTEFEAERALNSVPEGEYDFSKFYEEHGLTAENVAVGVIDAFNKEAKEAGLTQKQALAMARVQMKANAEYATQIATVRKGWLDDARADETIGRQNWTGSIAAGRKAIAEFGSPKLSEFFKQTGIGAHPEMIRFMSNVGKTLGEGKVENGGGAATTQTKSAADVFYGG